MLVTGWIQRQGYGPQGGLERASDDDKHCFPLDFNVNVVFMFVDEDLDGLMESLGAQGSDVCGCVEGCVLDDLERLNNDGYLSKEKEERCNPLGISNEVKEGGCGKDNNEDEKAGGYG